MEDHAGEDQRHLSVHRNREHCIVTKRFLRRRYRHHALGPCLHPPAHATAHEQRKSLAPRYRTRPPEHLLAQLLVTRDQTIIARRTAEHG